jgi:hypothetical protein
MIGYYFSVPFADSGDKTIIPVAADPGGAVSFAEGYTPDYSADQETDPAAKDVPRRQFNYFENVISGAMKEIQERGFKVYDALVNYPVNSYTIGSDGKIYKSLIINGPDTSVVDPVGDSTGTWIIFATVSYAKFSDTKTATDGGTFTQDAWQTRDLTLEDSDTDNLGTLLANQITLEPGTYICRCSAPAREVDLHKVRIYDTSSPAVLLVGTSENAGGGEDSTTRSFVSGLFIIDAQKVIEVQHYCSSTRASTGFGNAAQVPGTDDVYTIIELWRIVQ